MFLFYFLILSFSFRALYYDSRSIEMTPLFRLLLLSGTALVESQFPPSAQHRTTAE